MTFVNLVCYFLDLINLLGYVDSASLSLKANKAAMVSDKPATCHYMLQISMLLTVIDAK